MSGSTYQPAPWKTENFVGDVGSSYKGIITRSTLVSCCTEPGLSVPDTSKSMLARLHHFPIMMDTDERGGPDRFSSSGQLWPL